MYEAIINTIVLSYGTFTKNKKERKEKKNKTKNQAQHGMVFSPPVSSTSRDEWKYVRRIVGSVVQKYHCLRYAGSNVLFLKKNVLLEEIKLFFSPGQTSSSGWFSELGCYDYNQKLAGSNPWFKKVILLFGPLEKLLIPNFFLAPLSFKKCMLLWIRTVC